MHESSPARSSRIYLYVELSSDMNYQYNVFLTGDGRWRQVIRRCASVSETGVTGVCNWGVYDNGIYWEECYCSNDSCNGATTLKISLSVILLAISYSLYH